jgi:protein-S-isoprenylcysteine O-methyltransferase Ste14
VIADIILRLAAAAVLAAFWAVYFGKMIAQRRRGIRTDQMARGNKPRRMMVIELLLKTSTFATVCAQVASTALGTTTDCVPLRVAGVVVGVVGVVLFAIAVRTMRDSWRAGIPDSDRTELVTGGIYRVSRNPAFLAFDLVYAGVLAVCFSPVLAAFSLWGAVMMHLQIIEEEKFLTGAFGGPYTDYMSRTRRYWGTKRTT